MERLFVPYAGASPATVEVNGHRLIMVSADSAALSESLDTLGADEVRLVSGDSPRALLDTLSKKCNAGVVLTPPELPVEEVLRSLELELPWVM